MRPKVKWWQSTWAIAAYLFIAVAVGYAPRLVAQFSGYPRLDSYTGRIRDAEDRGLCTLYGGFSNVIYTDTASGSVTGTGTATASGTDYSTVSDTATVSGVYTATGTCTASDTQTVTISETDTASMTVTGTSTVTMSKTFTATETTTDTLSGTGTVTLTGTATETASSTWTKTKSTTLGQTGTTTYVCPSGTATSTQTLENTDTLTATLSTAYIVTGTATATGTGSKSWTYLATGTATSTCAAGPISTLTTNFSGDNICVGDGQQIINIVTSTNTATGSDTASETMTGSGTSTVTASRTFSHTNTGSGTGTCTFVGSYRYEPIITFTVTGTTTMTATGTMTDTKTLTATGTVSGTSTAEGTGTASGSWTDTVTESWTGTASQTGTAALPLSQSCPNTDTGTTASWTNTGTTTISATATVTGSATTTATATSTDGVISGSWTLTSTGTATDTCATGSESTITTTSTAVQGTGTDNYAAIWADQTSIKKSLSIYEDTAGNIGIDTTDPTAKVDVIAPGSTTTGIAVSSHEDSAYGGYFSFRRSRGTAGTPSALVDGDVLGNMQWQGYVDSGYLVGAQVSAVADSWDVPPYQRRTRLEFTVSDDAGTLASGATLNSFGLDVTGKVTDDASTVVCSTGMSCAGVTVTGTGTATGTGTGTFRLLAYGVPLTMSSTSTYTHTHTSTDVSGVAASTHTHAETFVLPNATVTKAVPGTATFATTAIGTTTPSASAIPVAGTDSKLATGWIPYGIGRQVTSTTSIVSGLVTSDVGGTWTDMLSTTSSGYTAIIASASASLYTVDDAYLSPYCYLRITVDGTAITESGYASMSGTGAGTDYVVQIGLTGSTTCTTASHTIKAQIASLNGSKCFVDSDRGSLTVQFFY